MKDELLFCPLGGSGEIGMNMNLFGYGQPGDHKWIMVDIGVTFADDTLPGVDLIYPDPGFIVEKKNNLLGIVLTHAHEDHVGGLEYYFDKINFTIFCTEFTFAYIRHKFSRVKNFENKFQIIKPYQEIKFENFSFLLIPTTHSIPDPSGVLIKSKNGWFSYLLL